MSFCTKCGRQHTGSNRFCSGCGNDFGEPVAASGILLAAEPVAGPPPTEEVPAVAEATRLESTLPDPFASGFAEQSPADEATPPSDEPADPWKTANAIYPRPAQATEYPPLSQPVAFPPPAHTTPRRWSRGGNRAAFIIVVVLVALAAGGGAYALVSRSHGHSTAQPTIHPTVAARANTSAPTTQASATASPSMSPSASATASPSMSPSASATASPAGTVQVASGVASNPAAPAVDAYLNRYFNSINTRNYSEYNSLLDGQKQQSDSKTSFDSGFATTKDSNEVLTGIQDTGGGSLTANMSFTSHQSPADSVDHNACNNWQLSLYLVPQGNSYVMTAAPASYTASYTDC